LAHSYSIAAVVSSRGIDVPLKTSIAMNQRSDEKAV